MSATPVLCQLTAVAEYDATLYSLSVEDVGRICNELEKIPYSDGVESIGSLFIRAIAGYKVVFLVDHGDDTVMVRVVRIQRQRPDAMGKRMRRMMSVLATIRGALGV
ncbi:MAG: hypothetical protein AAGI12_11755 [Pseudomonadota bacterium]